MNKIKTLGQVFAPRWIVDTILDEVGYKTSADILNQKLLEPSFGQGIFFEGAIDRLVKAGKKAELSDKEIAKRIDNNLHGVEFDQAVFSKGIRTLQEYAKLTHGLEIKLPNLLLGDAMAFENYGQYDYVVGNPPYVRVHHMDLKLRESVKKYSQAHGTTDLYVVFYQLGLKWLNKTGKLGYIAPNSWMRNRSQAKMRSHWIKGQHLKKIIDFGSDRVFDETSTYTAIVILDKKAKKSFVYESRTPKVKFKTKVEFAEIETPSAPLRIANVADTALLEEIRERETTVDDVANVQNGVATLGDKFFIHKKDEVNIEKELKFEAVKASTLRDEKKLDYKVALFPYVKKKGRYVGLTEKELQTNYPQAFGLLHKNKRALELRALDKNAAWFHYGRSQAIQATDQRKLVINPIISPKQTQINVAIVEPGTIVYSGLFITVPEGEKKWTLEKLKERIESPEFCSYAKLMGKDMANSYKNINAAIIKEYGL